MLRDLDTLIHKVESVAGLSLKARLFFRRSKFDGRRPTISLTVSTRLLPLVRIDFFSDGTIKVCRDNATQEIPLFVSDSMAARLLVTSIACAVIGALYDY